MTAASFIAWVAIIVSLPLIATANKRKSKDLLIESLILAIALIYLLGTL